MELLVKNIIKNEIRIRKTFLIRWSIASIIIIVLCLEYNFEILKTLNLISGLFGFLILIALNSFVRSPALRNNINIQQSNFSWKYLHSINANRQQFIKAHILASLILSLAFLIYLYLSTFVWNLKLDILSVLLITILYFLLVILIKLSSFHASVNQINLFSYKYAKPKNGVFTVTFIQIVLFWGSYCGAIILLYSFIEKTTPFYLFYYFISYLVITNILIYKKIIRCWRDERELRFDFRRDIKHFYMHILFLIIAIFLNLKYFGEVSLEDNRLRDAIENKNFKLIDKLVTDKKILNNENEFHYTALTEAILNDRSDIAEYLIDKGANLNIKIDGYNKNMFSYRVGMNALMLSLEHGNIKIADLLLKHGADINSLNREGLHSIHIATLACSLDSIEFLYNKKVDLDIKDKFGRTALFYIAERNCLASLLLLVKLGANTKITDNDGLNFEQYLEKNYQWFYRNYIFYNEKIK